MTAKKDDDSAEAAVANTAAAIQKATDEAEEKGFVGETVDPTPRAHYTVEGVLAGKPTPERTELEKK